VTVSCSDGATRESPDLAHGAGTAAVLSDDHVRRPGGLAQICNYGIRLASCVRDFTSSFRNTLRRWYSTVLGLMNS
jgi:hypothetical protein